MRKITFFLAVVLSIYSLIAQNTAEDMQQDKNKFNIGINYNYLKVVMEIQSLKSHSVWAGEDFGTDERTQEEIDRINSFAEYEKMLNGLNVALGMVLLDNPQKPIFIETNILLGLARKSYSAYNTLTDETEIKVKSSKLNPYLGIAFQFKYNFNESWGLKLVPKIGYSWGTSDDVDDNLYPVIQAFDETREDKSSFLYTRIDLVACYTVKNLTVSAGPGFYYLTNHHEYTLNKTDPDNGKTYIDTITSKLSSKYFIDASLGIEWRMINELRFIASCAIANDVLIHTGLIYNL